MQASTWTRSSLAATLLHLLGSDPGAGSTHNPLCSCQNSPVARCVIVVQSRWPRAVQASVAFGTESHHDAAFFLQKVLRSANRFSLNLPDATVPII